MGSTEEFQWSIPITDEQDDFPVRTSQRAELYAAGSGLAHMAVVAELNGESLGKPSKEPSEWIIVTDSEYVVKGMTEWLPKWRRNNWRTAKGTPPANLDLFIRLDEKIKECEKGGVKVGFWHVPREHNRIADSLAKSAAADGHLGSKFEDKSPLSLQLCAIPLVTPMDTTEG